MKKSGLLLSAIVAILFSSCLNEKGKVNEYVNDFVTKVQAGDVRSLHKMMPDLQHCDEFDIADYDADNVVIQKKDKSYHVRLSDNCSMVVLSNKRGELHIDKTYGVAVFDADLYNFALRTGWISQDMDDATVSRLLTDTSFRDFMIGTIMDELNEKVTVSGGHTGGPTMQGIGITINNDTDYNIPEEAYVVIYNASYANGQEDESVTFDGEDLPAHSSKTLSGTSRGTGAPADYNIRLLFDQEWLPNLCMLIYKANGHEYADWKQGKLN